MIELRDVSIYRGAWSLQHINWQVPRGEYTVLMGATGAGKSTLLEALCGLTPVYSGQVLIHDVDVTSASPAARRIGYVPQDLALFPTMTVRQHLEFGPRIRRWKPERIRSRVAELASVLELTPLLPRNVLTLSGGEAQRVAIGRALAFHPEVMLLDEPLSALDEELRGRLRELLVSVQASTGVTFLHVTHSRAEAESLSRRIVRLENHQLVEN